MTYDLIITGGGPAGMAAGIYAARKKIKTLFITESFGGQSVVASDIQNFIGFKTISGLNLAKILEEQLRSQNQIEIKDQIRASEIEKTNGGFIVKTDKGEPYETKTVLLALGRRYRKLDVPNEAKFEGRGVFYCTTCDAPLMKGKMTAVVGGGNAGVESAIDLASYASKVYLLEYTESLKADPITQEKIKPLEKIEVITMAQVKEIFGDEFVKGLKYEDRKSGKIEELAVEGIFISVGYQSNSEIAKNFVEINKSGEIIIDHKTQKTSCEGIWAAGDIADGLYHQNNIAIGDGIKAALDIYNYLKK